MESTSGSSKRSTNTDAHGSDDSGTNCEGDYSSGEPTGSGKRLKKDNSGINRLCENDICTERIRRNTFLFQVNENSTTDEQERYIENSENLDLYDIDDVQEESTSAENTGNIPCGLSKQFRRIHPNIDDSSDEDSDDNEEDEEEDEKVKPKNEVPKNYDPTPNTPKPKHNWIALNAITTRQYGFSSKYSPDLFRYNCYGALHMVERLELMYKMKKHEGCVNALNFNTSGTRLVSGSDDLRIIVWDWTISEPVLKFRSGHESNVFQAKFLPLCNDNFIVTCARDGQVRLADISSQGICKGTRKLAHHKASAHKLALQMDSPHYFLTCGEDAAVFGIDLRQEKHNKLLICKSKEKKVPLYTIFINPQKSHEFAVAGKNQYVKIYDSRYADQPVKEFCPAHLVDDNKVNVTSLVYNYNGQEILASYNDDDIYLFNANETDATKFVHRYRGHRNNHTVKGVNYFGSRSDYIMSGSDCGCIFFWDKESEHIVKYMYGDEGGAVNCLEQHPTMPILATSGLDDDIKIWVPSCEDPPDLSNLRSHITQNMKERDDEHSSNYPDAFVDQTIWFLMQHLSRTRRRRDITEGSDESSSPSSDDDMEITGVTSSQCNQS
ncbi:DDB1- and CUL4-associated factor 8 [Caerostris extrusa]|uniref:DDB1- and CUL4-associated factor 8 n=1 Tax=Caerostris extrusa TaxID=172846 RepID=A0AAV4PQI9_CAEEX|nr:DDB1- and CUL4-associated factor 8 [Caerostris extrusa]